VLTVEERLSRVYGLSLTGGLVFLAIGLVVHPVLWIGIGILVLAPLVSAVMVALEARGQDNGTFVAILLSGCGLILAVLVSLFLLRK
jgi:hypothetical protein